MRDHRSLVAGLISPFAAAALVMATSVWFERANDRLFTLSEVTFGVVAALVSSVPFWLTFVLVVQERRTRSFRWPGGLGFTVALLSLILPAFFVRSTVLLWIGMQHEAAHNVLAPRFQARDLNGTVQRFDEHQGEVVLVNVWATWCGYCLSEMPKLDRFYQENKNQGLMVFGLSDEDAATQRKGTATIPVSYPLLTYDGQIPGLYRIVASYPTTFIIDRRGILQPAVSGTKSFAKMQDTVLALLNDRP